VRQQAPREGRCLSRRAPLTRRARARCAADEARARISMSSSGDTLSGAAQGRQLATNNLWQRACWQVRFCATGDLSVQCPGGDALRAAAAATRPTPPAPVALVTCEPSRARRLRSQALWLACSQLLRACTVGAAARAPGCRRWNRLCRGNRARGRGAHLVATHGAPEGSAGLGLALSRRRPRPPARKFKRHCAGALQHADARARAVWAGRETRTGRARVP
jgi:hypothetical protein